MACGFQADGLMDGDELGAVGKGGLDLDLGDHFRTPSMTSARVRTARPALIISATLLPSRASSSRWLVMRATASG